MISVIVTNYNYGVFVQDAVRSVLRQDFTDFELIFADDGSTDDSLRIIRQIQDPRLKILELEHKGQLAAFSAGMRRASGEIIAFLDADDMYPPGYLRAVDEFYSTVGDCGFLFVGKRYFGAREGDDGRYEKVEKFGAHPFSAAMIHLWIGASTSACSIRRAHLEKILPLPDCEDAWKIRADDVILWGADIIGCVKYYSPLTYVLYRVHGSNNFFSVPKSDPEAEGKRREAAQKACLEIRERNGLTISDLLRKELLLGRYPAGFTLRAFIKFMRQWRAEKNFFRELFRCAIILPLGLCRKNPVEKHVRTALHLR